MKKLSGKYITVPLVRRVIGMPGHEASVFNGCVAMKIQELGKPGNRGKAKENFASAAAACKGKRNKK